MFTKTTIALFAAVVLSASLNFAADAQTNSMRRGHYGVTQQNCISHADADTSYLSAVESWRVC
jgi:hypothetical protein